MAHDDKPLVLVDGSSYLFRAFHALPPLTTSTGDPTGAMRGVVAMVRKLLGEHAGAPFAVVFDAPGPTFRDALYPAYKANRPPMPEDLRAQIGPTHAMIRALGIPLLAEPGVEADDVIGTLTRMARAAGRPVVISTGDKDMAQLVEDGVELINTMNDTRMDAAAVVERFGVTPAQIVDLLALMGDSVDNIPGVPKCGPKTAAKWLATWGTLDGVIANAAAIPGKVGESLRTVAERLPLSRELATIRCDVPLGVTVDDLHPQPADAAALRALYVQYEFSSWLRELDAPPAAAARPAAGRKRQADDADAAGEGDGSAEREPDRYEVVLDRGRLGAWVDRLRAAGTFAFDTETTSLDYMRAEIVGVSFSIAAGEAAYVPCAHNYPGAPDQIPRAELLAVLAPLLEDPSIGKIGQNLKYDANVLAGHGVTLAGIAHDTMLESYVLDSVGSRHNLDDLALRHLGRRTIHFEDVAGKGAHQLTFDQVPLETAGTYAAEDADVALQLHGILWPRLQAEPTLAAVYRDIELPLVPLLSKIERTGARVDGALLRQQGKEIAARLTGLRDQAWSVAGDRFNLDSTQQLQHVLYERLGLPALRKTPGGKPSTAEPALAELAIDHELPRLILEYRSLAKLKGTYTDKLPDQIHPATGRIHTSYHQAVAATGRLSSSDPNLQNIPVRTHEGRRIRQAFVAPPGAVLLAADYSQIELRIMAHLSRDAALLRAFADGLDVHRATAAEVFGCGVEEVSQDQRRSAKAINFGLIYGMSAFGLGRQLSLPRHVAQEYMDRYFERYPGVGQYMERTRVEARERGFVETLFGRRLYLPEIRVQNAQRRQAAERTAINAPMQGSAADIIKRAMLAVDAWLVGHAPEARIILQVHDELILEVPEAQVEAVGHGVRTAMEGAAALAVPLIVDIGTGANWDEAH